MTTTTVYIDSDPASLGDAATKADIERYARNLEARLTERFPDREIRVQPKSGAVHSLSGLCPSDDEVAEYVESLLEGSDGNGWLALLREEG